LAWQEFIKGKRHKKDVQEFAFHLMDNIFSLHCDLTHHTYKHGGYQQFRIYDPKPRIIHKASVCDRLVHHAVYRILYPYFDRTFTADSFSCRNDKGTHKALNRFRKKFFTSVDQKTLIKILDSRLLASLELRRSRRGDDKEELLNLLKEIITSFKSNGLPLGNLTSQLFANVYLNEFDQFVKHRLKIKYYIRYPDDFVIFKQRKTELENLIPQIRNFLQKELKLTLHPEKIYVKTIHSGLNFLGWINFKDHRILRTKTKRRMIKRLCETRPHTDLQVIQSYIGLLGHGNTEKLKSQFFKFLPK